MTHFDTLDFIPYYLKALGKGYIYDNCNDVLRHTESNVSMTFDDIKNSVHYGVVNLFNLARILLPTLTLAEYKNCLYKNYKIINAPENMIIKKLK